MMKDGSTGSRKIKRTLIYSAVLIAVYLFMILIAPGLTLWSAKAVSGASDDAVAVPVKAGDIYEYEFTMPYDRISGLEVPLYAPISDTMIPVDAVASITDNGGNVIIQKNITSVYDTKVKTGYIKVNKGEKYTFRLVIDSVDDAEGQDDLVPSVHISPDNGRVGFTLYGRNDGAPMKFIFTVVYFLVSALIIGFVYYLDENEHRKTCMFDRIVIAAVLVLTLVTATQYYDLQCVIKSGQSMIDAFAHGSFADYLDYSYRTELQSGGAVQMLVTDYDFLLIFPAAVLMLPLKILSLSDDICVLVFRILIIMSVLICARLMSRTASACRMKEAYSREAQMYFICSSSLIYMTVLFGQIDIFYVILILIALPFLYKGKYHTFSLLMSAAIAMKTLPVLIFIPLILLFNKKLKDVVVNLAIGASVPVLTHILFEGSEGGTAVNNMVQALYSHTDRLISVRVGNVSMFILFFAAVCAFSHFKKIDTEDSEQTLFFSMFTVFVVYSGFIIFTEWHVQWLIPLVLSASFLIPMCTRDHKTTDILNIAMSFLIILTANLDRNSTRMVNNGILPLMTGYYSHSITVEQMLENISPILPFCFHSLLAFVLIAMSFLFYRSRPGTEAEGDKASSCLSCRLWITAQTGVMFAFLLFYIWTYFYIG